MEIVNGGVIFNCVSVCRSGREMTNDEIAGMLIALLMAGQHTSSTTSAWMGFFLAKHQNIQVKLYK